MSVCWSLIRGRLLVGHKSLATAPDFALRSQGEREARTPVFNFALRRLTKVYQIKVKRLTGTDYREIHTKALAIYRQIKSRTKRRPYVRSAYFKKDKIFLDYFWKHLWQKNWRDGVRRLKYYPCVIDLLSIQWWSPHQNRIPINHQKFSIGLLVSPEIKNCFSFR